MFDLQRNGFCQAAPADRSRYPPDVTTASASRTIRSLYSAVNTRRCGRSGDVATSGTPCCLKYVGTEGSDGSNVTPVSSLFGLRQMVELGPHNRSAVGHATVNC